MCSCMYTCTDNPHLYPKLCSTLEYPNSPLCAQHFGISKQPSLCTAIWNIPAAISAHNTFYCTTRKKGRLPFSLLKIPFASLHDCLLPAQPWQKDFASGKPLSSLQSSHHQLCSKSQNQMISGTALAATIAGNELLHPPTSH